MFALARKFVPLGLSRAGRRSRTRLKHCHILAESPRSGADRPEGPMQQKAIKIGVIGPRGVGDIQGGIETYCSAFYKRLSPAKFDVTIFVSRAGPWVGIQDWIRTFHLPTSRLRVLETPVNSILGVVLS